MNSRLIQALKKLGAKCTAEGTNVHGDNIDGIIECIAEHFEAGGGTSVEVVQKTGESTTAVMSQKAVTDEYNGLDRWLESVESHVWDCEERLDNLETGSGDSSGDWINGYSEDASLLYVSISCAGDWMAPNVIIPQRRNGLGIAVPEDFYFTAYHWPYDDEEGEPRMDGFGFGYMLMSGKTGDSDFIYTAGLANGTFTRFTATATVIAHKL